MNEQSRETTPSVGVSRDRRIDALCDQFEDAWRRGERPVLRDHLDDLTDPALLAALRELLRLDIHYRTKYGEPPTATNYHQQFPDHTDLVDAVFQESQKPGPQTVDHVLDRSTADVPPSSNAAATNWPAIPGYEILDELGHGAMGVVYKARHIALRRTVALKMIRHADDADSQDLARFRAEAEAVARLQHQGSRWFAAAFHLRELLKLNPGDPDLQARLDRAVIELKKEQDVKKK